MTDRIRSSTEGYQQLESMLVKQLLEASGAFKGSGASGSDLRMGLFVEALSDAVAKTGGFGLAAMLERQIGSAEEPPAAKGAWDDPNSELALPDGYAPPDPTQELLPSTTGASLELGHREKKQPAANIVTRALIKYRERADAEDGVKSEKGAPPHAGVGP